MYIPRYLITVLNFIPKICLRQNIFLGFLPPFYHGKNIKADFFLLSFILFILHHRDIVSTDSSSPLTVSATSIISSAKAKTITPQIWFKANTRSSMYKLKSIQEVEYPCGTPQLTFIA